MSYQDRVRAHVRELRSTPDVVMPTCEIGSGTPRQLAADDAVLIGAAWGDDAVEGVRDYLLSTERIHVAWHTDDHYLYGEFALKDLRNCLSGWGLSDTDERLPPDKRQIMEWELKTLEEAPGSGRLTAVRMPAGAQSRELWFYDMNHQRLELLELDYQSYLDNLLLMKGAPGWQYLFTQVDLCDGEFRSTVSQLDRTLEALPVLFPGHDYSRLQERYEARCSQSPVFRRHKGPWTLHP
ncbi:hypothetical protein [Actinomadura rudentiformis]|uniref:Uncharacterized protein n=1 Tax=Actinomadura rudentiformis TaxID=359158 RepID=A0A6H9Z4V5_9ACTN|nr:hypothetical protein [Actinomadura rudentiformis]KAB2350012.1 hypothetical protein F8566_09260 [Actinomadura rudentiformis]